MNPLVVRKALTGFLFAVVSISLMFPSLAAYQINPANLAPGTASISGVVVDATTGAPIAGAAVETRRTSCSNLGARSDSAVATSGPDGRFTLDRLRAGNWCVGAAHASGRYTPAEYLQTEVLGRGVTVTVLDAQRVQDIRLAMAPTGVIAGRVVDEAGYPLGRARVQVMRAYYEEGQRRLSIMNVVQTDDRGDFRFYWLPPGEYFVSAIPEDVRRQRAVFSVAPPGMAGHRRDVLPPTIFVRTEGRGETIEEAFVPAYYGGGIDGRSATPINLRPGENLAGISVSLAGARMRAWHIRGSVDPAAIAAAAAEAAAEAAAAAAALAAANPGLTLPPPPANSAPPSVQLRLAPREWTALAVMPFATAGPDGSFDIPGVVPGSYALYATVAGAVAYIPVDVGNANMENLRVFPRMGAPMSGRIVIENGQLPASAGALPLRVVLMRDPDTPGIPTVTTTAPVKPDLTFAVPRITHGEYRVYLPPLLNPPQQAGAAIPEILQDAYVRSIRFGSAELLGGRLNLTAAPDTSLDVVIAPGGRLAGAVVDDRLQRMANVKVALVPSLTLRQRADLYRTATTDETGVFQIRGVPPGDYTAFAWRQVPDGAWQDAEFIRNYETRGKSVRITPGGSAQVDLEVIAK